MGGWLGLILDVWLFVQNQIQQGFVNLDVAVVGDKSQFPKSIHEETDAGPRGSDHLGKCLLADFGEDRLRPSFVAIICQNQ